MIEVKFTGNTWDDIREHITLSLGFFELGSGSSLPTQPTKQTLAPEAQPTPAAVKRGPGRPRKNPAPAEPPVPTDPVVIPEEVKPLTVDDARWALQEVMNRHGMPRVMHVLKQFTVDRLSDLTADRYKDFIAACQQAAAEE